MGKKTKISIVMPNYNSSLFLEQTVKSIINQSFFNWELILVDDNSNFQTKKILKKYSKIKKIKIFFLKRNRGDGYCRLYGVKKAHSNIIAFIDSDDIWKKEKLETQIRFMESNNYFFTYTQYETFGKKKITIYPSKDYDYKKFIHDTSICTSTMIVRKEILKGVEFTNSKICEDYYFKCKILQSYNAYCLEDVLTKYRIRDKSLQSSSLRNFYWIWKINRQSNKLNLFENLKSVIFISLNSLRKYGLK